MGSRPPALLCAWCLLIAALQPRSGVCDLDDVLSQHSHGGKAATLALSNKLANRHFDAHGAKRPSAAFVAAVRAASLWATAGSHAEEQHAGHAASRHATREDVHARAAGSEGRMGGTGQGERRQVVIMAMANDVALQLTVPAFVRSLAAVLITPAGTQAAVLAATKRPVSEEEGGAGGAGAEAGAAAGSGSLADHLVLACSSPSAADKCRALGLGDRCVVDDDMALGNKSLPFHSIGFNMIGLQRYILNALSLGRDVIFMDTDVVVFQDFVPYILSMGADMAATVEKCRVVDDKADYGGRPIKGFPMFNIGVTYFRARPAVLRCVYNWLYDMWTEVRERPRVWDQDVFRKVMFHCTKSYGVRLHVFSPRHLNSYCFKPCGCDYAEADISTQADRQLKPVGFSSAANNGTCPAHVVSQWMLMHFPCAGETTSKAELMHRYAQMRLGET